MSTRFESSRLAPPHPNPLPLGEGTADAAPCLCECLAIKLAARLVRRLKTLLPLPLGEGRGEGKTNRRWKGALCFVAALLGCYGCTTTAPKSLADARLSSPQDQTERAYLGLEPGIERFSQEDVHAEILVIDFFDMYCHVCQVQSAHMNEFYKLTQARGAGDRLKIIGVGVGDTPLEARLFKEKCKVPFPVFPDRGAAFAKQFGKIRVPSLVVLKRQNGYFQMVYQAPALPAKPDELLSQLLSNAPLPSVRQSKSQPRSEPTCEKGGTQCGLRQTKAGWTDTVPEIEPIIDAKSRQSHEK